MARPNAPVPTGNTKRRPHFAPPEQALEPTRKGWPFAEGSQNHLDETSAPWPRPSARPTPVQPARPVPQE